MASNPKINPMSLLLQHLRSIRKFLEDYGDEASLSSEIDQLFDLEKETKQLYLEFNQALIQNNIEYLVAAKHKIQNIKNTLVESRIAEEYKKLRREALEGDEISSVNSKYDPQMWNYEEEEKEDEEENKVEEEEKKEGMSSYNLTKSSNLHVAISNCFFFFLKTSIFYFHFD